MVRHFREGDARRSKLLKNGRSAIGNVLLPSAFAESRNLYNEITHGTVLSLTLGGIRLLVHFVIVD